MGTAIENAEDVMTMTYDLNRGKSVYIGFCYRQDEDFIRKLRNIKSTEVGFLTELILNQGSGDNAGGDIKFTKLSTGLIKAEIMTIEDVLLKEYTITSEHFSLFANLTVDFAVFLCNDGNDPLNI